MGRVLCNCSLVATRPLEPLLLSWLDCNCQNVEREKCTIIQYQQIVVTHDEYQFNISAWRTHLENHCGSYMLPPVAAQRCRGPCSEGNDLQRVQQKRACYQIPYRKGTAKLLVIQPSNRHHCFSFISLLP